MQKRLNCIVIIVIVILSFPIIVRANIVCNDGTISDSCQDCHRGCCSSHGGCSNSSSGGSSNSGTSNNNSSANSSGNVNTEKPVVEEVVKDSDTTLKEVIVNNKSLDIANEMFYNTTNESVIIKVVANSAKATLDYNKNSQLNVGNNIVNIKVTAENGNVKTYKINITREKILSDNKNIKIKVNGIEVIFNVYKSDTINIPYEEDKVNIEYELEDKNARAEIIGNIDLIVGQNEIIVKVTAENGSEQNYIIIVERNVKEEANDVVIDDNKEEDKNTITNKNEEQQEDDTNPIIPLAILGGAGYGVYKFRKRKK